MKDNKYQTRKDASETKELPHDDIRVVVNGFPMPDTLAPLDAMPTPNAVNVVDGNQLSDIIQQIMKSLQEIINDIVELKEQAIKEIEEDSDPNNDDSATAKNTVIGIVDSEAFQSRLIETIQDTTGSDNVTVVLENPEDTESAGEEDGDDAGGVGISTLVTITIDNVGIQFLIVESETGVSTTVVSINTKPVVVDDAYTVAEDNTLNVQASDPDALLSNDSDAENDALSVSLVTSVSHGSLVLNSDGSFTYTPDENFNGSDSFTYRVNDGNLNSDTAEVTITVTAENDAPTESASTIIADEDVTYTFSLDDFNFYDVDGDQLDAVVITSLPDEGSLLLNGSAVSVDDSVSRADIEAGLLRFVPVADAFGASYTTFMFKLSDGVLLSDSATMTIDVNEEIILGDNGDNNFVSESDRDTYNGLAGEDQVSYENASSAVTVDVDAGTVSGGDSDTLISIESIKGSDYNDFFYSLNAGYTIDGGAGNDTVSYENATDAINISLSGLSGGGGADIVDAGGGALPGGGGVSDTLQNIENIIGSVGNDTITGDSADNILEGGKGNDTINGGDGTDTLSYEHASGSVSLNLASGTASGADGSDTFSNIEKVLGGGGNDTFKSELTANYTIDGGNGSDTLSYENYSVGVVVDLEVGLVIGPSGSDFFSNIENITGGSGGDTLTGDSGINQLSGGNGVDTLYGGSGNDTLTGGNGSDILDGGSNDDILTGGDGGDFFVASLGFDIFTDFSVGEDFIDVRAIEDANGTPTYAYTSDDFGTFIKVLDSGNDTLIQILDENTLPLANIVLLNVDSDTVTTDSFIFDDDGII